MSVRFPLFAKILLWFFLNLVFLSVVFYVFFKVQFQLGLDSLLTGRTGEHIDAAKNVIVNELNQSAPPDWDKVLKRFSEGYRVGFYLFRDDGLQLAGESITLPPQVLTTLVERRGPRLGPGPPVPRPDPQRRRDFPPPPGEEGQDGPGPFDAGRNRLERPGAEPRPDDPEMPRPGMLPRGPHPRFMVHTSNPSRYWVLARIQIKGPERPRPLPATLVAVSSSIRGSGLFFDFVPWIWVGAAVLLVSVLFWFPLVRSITRCVSQLTRATEAIAEGQFDVPVESDRRDELGRLSQAIHRMESRLSGFVHGQKRFLGDIAHELCSPLARVQVALGILEERGDPNLKSYVEDVREEVQEMSSLVAELLSFSKAGLRKQEIKLQPVALGEIAKRVVKREAPDAKQLEIQIDDSLQVLAEPELLSRALANLIRNAVRYAGDAGPITLSATSANDAVTIIVADQGPGVPEETLGQIFDPFFRLEASRSRDTGGIGLGLAIVKTCVEACQGTVTARNRQPNGLEVVIVLRVADS